MLGGTLDVSSINGFTPYNGEQFVILTSAGLSGTFNDGVIHDGNITFTVEYSPTGYTNHVVLNVDIATVPAPASLLLLGLGVAGMGIWGSEGPEGRLIAIDRRAYRETAR